MIDESSPLNFPVSVTTVVVLDPDDPIDGRCSWCYEQRRLRRIVVAHTESATDPDLGDTERHDTCTSCVPAQAAATLELKLGYGS